MIRSILTFYYSKQIKYRQIQYSVDTLLNGYKDYFRRLFQKRKSNNVPAWYAAVSEMSECMGVHAQEL